MPLLLDLLEGAGELDGEPRYGPAVRAELEAMSAATIDRYLAPAGARAVRGRSTTKAGPLLRSSIKIRRAGDEVEAEPGFFEVDTVAHCGPVLKGEFARTVEHDPMCSRGGPSPARSATTPRSTSSRPWTPPWTRSRSPCWAWTSTTGRNSSTTAWCGGPGTWTSTPARSRPYRKNDQATIESKNNHVVRRYAFYYRYDTDAERQVPGRLWEPARHPSQLPDPHPQAHRVGR